MALSKDQIIQLQGSAKARKLFALEFSTAFAKIHRNFPTPSGFANDADYNKAAKQYNQFISVKSKLESATMLDGKIDIWACNMLLSALETYPIDVPQGADENTLINRVLNFTDQGAADTAIQVECDKLLKGWSFQAMILPEPAV
jgi:hypothetical protein